MGGHDIELWKQHDIKVKNFYPIGNLRVANFFYHIKSENNSSEKYNSDICLVHGSHKSEGVEESFSNINDDFNDVLLFGLLGIFFLIFTDYVYKLGRKSY